MRHVAAERSGVASENVVAVPAVNEDGNQVDGFPINRLCLQRSGRQAENFCSLLIMQHKSKRPPPEA